MKHLLATLTIIAVCAFAFGQHDNIKQPTVADYLPSVILATYTTGELFIVVWDGRGIDYADSTGWRDVTTTTDDWGRVLFTAPDLLGTIDVSQTGDIIIDIERASRHDMRFITDDGHLLTLGQCRCPSVGGTICGKADCDAGHTCHGSIACRWYVEDGVWIGR